MSARTLSRRWLGPAIAASLWIGFAPAPAPGLSTAAIAAILGHTARRTEAAAPTQSRGRESGDALPPAQTVPQTGKDPR